MEQFTEDLYVRFRSFLDLNNEEAVEIYERMLKFLDKKRDEETSEPWNMEDLSPMEYQRMHEQRMQ